MAALDMEQKAVPLYSASRLPAASRRAGAKKADARGLTIGYPLFYRNRI